MYTFATPPAMQASSGDGLSLRDVIAQVPTDPASVVTLLLLIACLVLVLWTGTRPRGKGGRPA